MLGGLRSQKRENILKCKSTRNKVIETDQIHMKHETDFLKLPYNAVLSTYLPEVHISSSKV